MSQILIVGGYGGFGGRLARRLAKSGRDVLVGGRSIAKARAYCSGVANCRPILVDRRCADAVLAAERPALVIDAAGPFQSSDYCLPKACIAAGVHYLDLADARQFVTGIGVLDEPARLAGTCVISGASSVPALSHAVVAELAEALDQVDAIEIAISASGRASAGDSVATAILGGAGQPLSLWHGRRWQRHYGWQEIRREKFALPSGKSLGARLVALADVPDLELLPKRFAGVSSVVFRAGTECAAATAGLWLASWPVRWGIIKSLEGTKRLLVPLHRLIGRWGSDRSGMVVRLFGRDRGKRVERRWTLIAERGDGPDIPTLAAAILADRILAGAVDAGARHAGGVLTLADFEPGLANLATGQSVVELELGKALYARVMGDDFERLSPAVRSMHDVLRDQGAAGAARVERGTNPLARLIAKVMRFPAAGDHRLHVHFEERDGVERWTRDFGGNRFSSRLRAGSPGTVIESFGPLRFHFRLRAEEGALCMDLVQWSLGPLPLPRFLAPRSPAREWEADGRFHFDVPIDLPFVGRVVHYRGWLKA